MSAHPAVSVLLPAYNGANYLGLAIDSVLNQTRGDFELLLLDDGSTDETWQVVAAFDDQRLQHLRTRENLGLSRQLNRGLALARGRYIARIDADDIAYPERFERQVALLESEPAVGICGSHAQLFDSCGDLDLWEYPADSDEVHAALFARSPFLHPGVMMRRSVLEEHGLRYDRAFVVAQDYELWRRLLQHTKGRNLPEPLTSYRISETQLTSSYSVTKLREARAVRARLLEDLDLPPTRERMRVYDQMLDPDWDETVALFKSASAFLNEVFEANERSGTFPRGAFGELLAEMFFHRCQCASRRGLNGLAAFAELRFGDRYRATPMDRLRMRLKSVLKPALES